MSRERSVSAGKRLRFAGVVGPALAFSVATCATISPAYANPAAAEVLFKEGKRLLAEGKLDDACPKFAESQRLDPSPGTQLNLAACYEKQGKLASAWAEFLQASRLASQRGQEGRSGEAKQRAAALEPRLSYLTVRVAQKLPGLVVRRNDEALTAAQFDLRVPTDPGEYAITAEAPGYKPFRSIIQLEPEGGDASVDVAALAPESKQPDPEPSVARLPVNASAERGAAPKRARPVAGYVAGGLGVAAVGVGATFGLMALSSYAKAEDACPARTGCTKQALDDRDQAQTQALVANVGVAAGLAGVGLGTYLLFFSASKPKTSTGQNGSPDVALVARPAGVALCGRF